MGARPSNKSYVTQEQRIPAELMPFLVGQDGILGRADELSKMPITMPEHQVADRNELQSMADRLGVEGIGSFLPMLQQSFDAVRSGISATGLGLETTRDALAQLPGLRDRALSYMDEGAQLTRGSTGAFNPASYEAFMNPYIDAVVRQAEADIYRQGQMQQQELQSRAAGMGAFGGSRAAIAERELGRNIMDQQARTAAGLRAEGFGQAMSNAMDAFRDQQARTAAAGGQLAQIGSGVGQTGGSLVAQQMAGGQQQGQLGMGLGSLGGQMAGMAEQGQRQNLQDIQTLTMLGDRQQAFEQARLDALRQTQVERILQPFQQLGFFADIFQGSPTGTNTLMTSASPGPSPASQLAGLGLGLGSLYQAGVFNNFGRT